jgi:superfamily II DNA or RNA helicase
MTDVNPNKCGEPVNRPEGNLTLQDGEEVRVCTYDSAYIHAEELGNKFELLIADEVHHLFAPGYSQAAELFAAPYRMGLTSTLHRADMRHLDAPRLIGGVVYEVGHGGARRRVYCTLRA